MKNSMQGKQGEIGEIATAQKRAAKAFNNFFGNTIKNLYISQYSDFNPIIIPSLKSYLN